MDDAKVRLNNAYESFKKDNATLLLNLNESTTRLIFVHGYLAGLGVASDFMAEVRRAIWGPRDVDEVPHG